MQRPRKSPIVKLLALTLTFAMLLGIAITAAAAPAYPDISGHWGETAIEKWSAYDVLHGNDLGTFEPDGELDVTQLAQILVNTFGYTESYTGSLSGYTSTWGEETVRKAVAAGAIEAGEAALPLTRELAAKIVAKAFGIAPVSGASKFSDDYAISSEYKPYVAAVGKAGIFNGNDYGEFMPAETFSRAAIMQALDNAVTDIVKENKAAESSKSVILNKGGVTLTEGVIEGDLIIAQGVADGDITLDSVTIKGRLVIFGGGVNSIHIKGKSSIPNVTIAKTFGQAARFVVESVDATVGTVTVIAESKATVATTNNASVSKVTIAPKTQVSATGELTGVTTAAAATVTISAKVETLAVETKATVTVSAGATVAAATIEASDVKLSGAGKVTAVTVTADAKTGVEVRTSGTKVTVDKDAGAVTTNSGKIEPGKTATTGSSSSSGGDGGIYNNPSAASAAIAVTVGLSPGDAEWPTTAGETGYADVWDYYSHVDDDETGGVDTIYVDSLWIDGSDGYTQDEIGEEGTGQYFVKVMYSNYAWNDAISALKLNLAPARDGTGDADVAAMNPDRYYHDVKNKTIYWYDGVYIATGSAEDGWIPNGRFNAKTMDITASILESGTIKIGPQKGTITWPGFEYPEYDFSNSVSIPEGGFYTLAPEESANTVTVASKKTLTVGEGGTVTVPADVELKVVGELAIAGTVAVEEGAKITFDDDSKLSGTGTIAVQEGGELVGSVTGVSSFWDGDSNTAAIVYGPGAKASLGDTLFIGTEDDDCIVVLESGNITQSKNKFTLDADGEATVQAGDLSLIIFKDTTLDIQGALTVAGELDIQGGALEVSGTIAVEENATISFDNAATLAGDGIITVADGGTVVGTSYAKTFWNDNASATIVYGSGAIAMVGTVEFIGGENSIVQIEEGGTVTQSKDGFTLKGAATVAAGKTLSNNKDDTFDIQGTLTVAGNLEINGSLVIADKGVIDVKSATAIDINGALVVNAGGTIDASGDDLTAATALFNALSVESATAFDGDDGEGVLLTISDAATITLYVGAKIKLVTGQSTTLTGLLTAQEVTGYVFTEGNATGEYTLMPAPETSTPN